MSSRILISAMAVLLSLGLVKASHANSLSYRVDKSKVRLIIPAGGSQAGTLKVYSQSEDKIKIKIHFEDWSYADQQDGTKDFYPPGTTPLSCSEWISVNPQEFTLPPYGTQTVNFVAEVPEEAQGAYFSVMFFETTFLPGPAGLPMGPDELRVGTSLNVKLGTLFYIEAEDSVQRQGQLQSLFVQQDAAAKFFSVNLNFKNTGNTDITTHGNFDLIDAKGMVYARGEFNDSYTLPGQEAKLSSVWKKLIDSGIYDLVITLDLGKSIEEAGLGRGPVIVKEARIEIGSDGRVTAVGELR
jgi:hypothetical protein